MMCRRRRTWNTGKVLGVEDLKRFRERIREYARHPFINSPRPTVPEVEPVKSRRESARSSSAQGRGQEKASWSRTEMREGGYLLPNVAQAQPQTEGPFCADTEIAKDKQDIYLVFIILDVSSGGD
jgi:hypothetical protein